MRDKQPVIAVLAVVLVVIGFVWLSNILTSNPAPAAASTPTTETTTSATASETTSSTPIPTPSVLPGCTPVPALQTAPKKMTTAPDVDGARGKTFVATITTN